MRAIESHSAMLDARTEPPGALREAVARERIATVGVAARVRFVGALAFFAVALGCWLTTKQADWYVYLSPLALFAAGSALLLALRERIPLLALTWLAAVVDVGLVYYVQWVTEPLSQYPAGVAGFSLGLFALTVCLTGLSMQMSATMTAAFLASVGQCRLMAAAHVSVGPMVTAVLTLFLVAWTSQAGTRRVWLLARRLFVVEAERLAAHSRNADLAMAQEHVRTMLSDAEARNMQLVQLQRDRDDLARILVHDLRNPLTTLTTSLGMIDRQLKNHASTAQLQTVVDRSIRSTTRLSEMITQLLDIARLEEGRLAPRPGVVSPMDLIPAGWSETGDTRLWHPGFKIDVDVDLQLRVDRELLTRVLENLLSNAQRYTPEGGHILLCCLRQGTDCVISLHNDGDPIAGSVRHRLFGKFERGEETGRSGWGLGLYFCKLAIEAHGGTITIEDVPGWPVSFVIRLPSAAVPNLAWTAPPGA